MSTDSNRRPAAPAPDSAPTATITRPAAQGAIPRWRLVLSIVIASALVALYLLLSDSTALATLTDGPSLRAHIEQFGWAGPFAITVLMTVAIVVSPIPSAPIALAAGAVYGHTLGTIYVLVGAEAGALIAFTLARVLGCNVMQRVSRQRPSLQLLGSQNTLMAIVFVSRLLPFISFDIVSYAAGLTSLSLWRFAVATLAGIIPASFLLAHFGAGMVSSDPDRIALSILALGTLTLIPIAIKLFRDRRRRQH